METVALVLVCAGSLLIVECWGHAGRAVERSLAYREALTGAIREPYGPAASVLHTIAPDRAPVVTVTPWVAITEPA